MSALRTVAARPAKVALRAAGAARTVRWPAHTRLFVVGDGGGWSVDEDAEHVRAAARRVGVHVAPTRWARFAGRQAVFVTSHFAAVEPTWLGSSHRLGTAWLHGRPGTPGHPEFDRALAALRARPTRFAALQVTHAEMHELVVAAGVPAERVHRIPLGIDLEHFLPPRGPDERRAARAELGLPADAFVVGSFQKDGVGWGAGDRPKLVKGPDVLVEALASAHRSVPELHVLLLGPARGYVLRELADRGVPATHRLVADRAAVARAYHALDAYVIPARQEGGPKSALESLATGVPLVSTSVGQVPDVVTPGVTAHVVDVGDAAGLAAGLVGVADGSRPLDPAAARATAERHALERLDPLWSALFADLLGPGGA